MKRLTWDVTNVIWLGTTRLAAGRRHSGNTKPYVSGGAVGGGVCPKANHGICLWSFLAFDYVELDLIAFFERLVSIQLNC
jgi:hypothetical protein